MPAEITPQDTERARRTGSCEFCGAPNHVLMRVAEFYGAVWRCSACRIALWRAEQRAIAASQRLVAAIDTALPRDPKLAAHLKSDKGSGLRTLRAHVKALEAAEASTQGGTNG